MDTVFKAGLYLAADGAFSLPHAKAFEWELEVSAGNRKPKPKPKPNPIREARATRALTTASEWKKLENKQSAAQFIRRKNRQEDIAADTDTQIQIRSSERCRQRCSVTVRVIPFSLALFYPSLSCGGGLSLAAIRLFRCYHTLCGLLSQPLFCVLTTKSVVDFGHLYFLALFAYAQYARPTLLLFAQTVAIPKYTRTRVYTHPYIFEPTQIHPRTHPYIFSQIQIHPHTLKSARVPLPVGFEYDCKHHTESSRNLIVCLPLAARVLSTSKTRQRHCQETPKYSFKYKNYFLQLYITKQIVLY